jgi:hypothetical protein
MRDRMVHPNPADESEIVVVCMVRLTILIANRNPEKAQPASERPIDPFATIKYALDMITQMNPSIPMNES